MNLESEQLEIGVDLQKKRMKFERFDKRIVRVIEDIFLKREK